jgi:hypothetical protein
LASLLRDTFEGLRSFWANALPNVDVRLGFAAVTADDESQAISGEPAHDYPCATLTLLSATIDLARKSSGPPIDWAAHPTETNRMMGKRPPIPVTLTIQLDTYADDRADDWTMNETCLRVLGRRRSKFSTADGRMLYLVPETTDTLDDLAGDSIWRKAYRFNLEAWISDEEEVVDAYKVLIRHFDINSNAHVIDSSGSVE